MNITAIDWIIVLAYFALSTLIGFIFTKRGGESLEEYFLSGRQVPWWLAGAAMVATTFAADTPLVVTGLVGNLDRCLRRRRPARPWPRSCPGCRRRR